MRRSILQLKQRWSYATLVCQILTFKADGAITVHIKHTVRGAVDSKNVEGISSNPLKSKEGLFNIR